MRLLTILAVLSCVVQCAFVQEDVAPSEYLSRRQALASKFQEGLIVIPCKKPGVVGDDANTPLFDFQYLTGIYEPGAVLVIEPTEKEAILFVPKNTDKLTRNGISKVLPVSKWEDFLKSIKGCTFHVDSFQTRETRSLGDFGTVKRDVARHLSKMRALKSESEINLVKKAAEITCKAHIQAMKRVKPGMNEKELQKIIESTFKENGSTGLGFPSIVGSGKHGTILHYMENNDTIPEDTLIVIDIGCEYKKYVADVTRTIPSSGKFNEKQKHVYETVLKAQKAAEQVLKPGATWAEIDAAARKVFEAEKLTKWSYAHSKDFSVRHGLGHFVGLAVHDSGPYDEKFQPGMIITIEPGYYDKDEGWGVRIEDMYLVTKDGNVRLSTGAPREVEEIEKMMSDKK